MKFSVIGCLFIALTCIRISKSCTCSPMDFAEEFCWNFNGPKDRVLKITILHDVKKRSLRFSATRAAHSSYTTSVTPRNPTTSFNSWRGKVSTFTARIDYVYRGVSSDLGRRITIISSNGMCGIGDLIHPGTGYVVGLKSPASMENYMLWVYMCDFFINSSYHHRLPNPDRYFMSLRCGKDLSKTLTTPIITTVTTTATTTEPLYFRRRRGRRRKNHKQI